MCREAFASIKLFIIGNIINQLLGGFPSKAGIRDGFAIHAAADLLAAFFDIAFHHNTLNKLVNMRVELTAVHNLFGDTNLLLELFVGVVVININNAGRIL